jgi:hypothetical protein
MQRFRSTRARVIIVVVIAVAVGTSLGATRLVSSAHGADITVSQLDQIATSLAAGHGDASPTAITYVATTRQAANQVAGGEQVDSNPPSYLIAEQGNFVDQAAVPPGSSASPPSGSVLTIVVDQQSGQVLDIGIGNQQPQLSSLGPVATLPG